MPSRYDSVSPPSLANAVYASGTSGCARHWGDRYLANDCGRLSPAVTGRRCRSGCPRWPARCRPRYPTRTAHLVTAQVLAPGPGSTGSREPRIGEACQIIHFCTVNSFFTISCRFFINRIPVPAGPRGCAASRSARRASGDHDRPAGPCAARPGARPHCHITFTGQRAPARL